MMPTKDRPEFARQAIEAFQAQTYPNRELVIVDSGQLSLDGVRDPRIRHARVDTRTSIGKMRNLACRLSRGEYVAFWDDDDIHGSERLEAQSLPLIRGDADLTVFRAIFVYFKQRDQTLWPNARARSLFRRLCCTQVFRREIWRNGSRFPIHGIGEDLVFFNAAVAHGAKVCEMDPHPHYCYVRHGKNTWALESDSVFRRSDWTVTRGLPTGNRPTSGTILHGNVSSREMFD